MGILQEVEVIPSNQLLHFYHVARMGSIRKAARYLDKSQSSISTAIKILEDDLDCQLLVRTANATELTDKGRQLYNFAQDFLKASDSLREDLRWKSNSENVLKLGINKHYDEFAAPLIKNFLLQYPDTELQIHFTDGEFLRQEFRQGDLDAILGINFNLAGVATDELTEDTILVMKDSIRLTCSKDHPLANRKNLTIDDLKDCSFILPSFYLEPVKQFFNNHKSLLKLRATTNHAKISAQLLAQTRCLSLLAPGTMPERIKSSLAFPEFGDLDLNFQIIMRFQRRHSFEGLAINRLRKLAEEWISRSFS